MIREPILSIELAVHPMIVIRMDDVLTHPVFDIVEPLVRNLPVFRTDFLKTGCTIQ